MSTRDGAGPKETFNLTLPFSVMVGRKTKRGLRLLKAVCVPVPIGVFKTAAAEAAAVMWSNSFCSAGSKQMGYLEPTSFALVEKGQERK